MKIVIYIKDKNKEKELDRILDIGSLIHKKYNGFKKGRTSCKDGKTMLELEK